MIDKPFKDNNPFAKTAVIAVPEVKAQFATQTTARVDADENAGKETVICTISFEDGIKVIVQIDVAAGNVDESEIEKLEIVP